MVILQKNWLLHKLLKQILLNREMQKTLILFIGFFLYCAEISANPKDSISTYYKIYAIDKKWFGKLNEVIIDFNDNEIDSRFILPQFAARRLNCGKRCFKGRPCRTCNAIEELAALLESENLMIKDFEK